MLRQTVSEESIRNSSPLRNGQGVIVNKRFHRKSPSIHICPCRRPTMTQNSQLSTLSTQLSEETVNECARNRSYYTQLVQLNIAGNDQTKSPEKDFSVSHVCSPIEHQVPRAHTWEDVD